MANKWARSQRVISVIGGRWTLAVLNELQKGGRRYQELDDGLGDVSHKVLTDTLRRAERDGLVVRHLDPGRVETATLYGTSLRRLGKDGGRETAWPVSRFWSISPFSIPPSITCPATYHFDKRRSSETS